MTKGPAVTRLSLTLAAALILTPMSGSAADLQDGFDAATKGNYPKAVQEWQPLAQAGDALAQFNLAYLYRRGLGVRQNDRTAFDLTRKAAGQGLADAQYQLAEYYAKAIGTKRDLKQAARWAHLAARQGNSLAAENLPGYQHALGKAYLSGDNTYRQHRAKAYIWFTMAAASGDDKAQTHLTALEKTLSQYRLKKARTAAVTYQTTDYVTCW